MRPCSFVAVAIVCLLYPSAAGADKSDVPSSAVLDHALRAYKWFHQHPELSGEEEKTAARLASELKDIGMEVHEGIGGHGIVAILHGDKKGRGAVVLYRADMDALPVKEATGVKYASKTAGVMHACGHDIHMATAIGALQSLAARKSEWSGTILFVGQPAEEVGRGARQMLADKKFKKLVAKIGAPKVALALHDRADLPAGRVSMLPGFANANVDSVDIVIHGKGGHGARPHQTIDPIVIGAEIVLALQTIVSRRIEAGEKAVVTVGKFSAGTKHNIIPPQATLLLTVRSYSDETRAFLLEEIERIAINVARAHRAPKRPTVTVKDEYTPAAYNDPTWTKKLEKEFQDTLGESNVERHKPSLGGEDFGRFSRQLKIPGVMWALGAVTPRTWKRAKTARARAALPGLHSNKWAPSAKLTLRTGITTVTAALRLALASD